MVRTVVVLFLLFVFVAACTPPKWILPRMNTFDERFHFDVPHVKPTSRSGGDGVA